MKFSENITTLRKKYGLNQTEFTEMVGIERTNLWHYETCRKLPNCETAIRIADIFHVSVDWLLGRDTSKDGQPLDYVGMQEKKRLLKIEKLYKELAKLEGDGEKCLKLQSSGSGKATGQ